MKSNLIALTTATLLAVGGGMLTPVSVQAAADKSPNAVYFSTDNVSARRDVETAKGNVQTAKGNVQTAKGDVETAKSDVDTKDLDAKLAEARARLEQAAHDVAELSSEMAWPLMDKLMVFNGEGVPPAVIGVQLDPQSSKDGARIREVSPGGPAAEAGIHVGDVITALNGTDVKGEGTARQVIHLMHKVAPESKIKVRVTREGKPRDFMVTARPGMTFFGMQEPGTPPMGPMGPDFPGGGRPFGPVLIHGPLGEMELATLTPQLGRYFGTDKGVLVVRAPKDFKLEDGDVILAIDGREPTSGSHATRILGSYQPGEKIAIKLMRQQKTLNVETTLPERGPAMGPGPDRKVRMMIHDGAAAMT